MLKSQYFRGFKEVLFFDGADERILILFKAP
jgi:hypothetical protein